MPHLNATELYLDHSTWLVSWLRRRLRSHDQAADLVQELFCRLVERPPAAEIEKPRAFLTTSATRLLIDQKRRRAIEQAYLEALASTQGQEQAITPHDTVEAVEALTAISRILDEMAERPRQAFLLSRLEGLTHAEIAPMLGVSTSMVKQYIASALVHCYGVVHSPS